MASICCYLLSLEWDRRGWHLQLDAAAAQRKCEPWVPTQSSADYLDMMDVPARFRRVADKHQGDITMVEPGSHFAFPSWAT
jgi:hypothetical protein